MTTNSIASRPIPSIHKKGKIYLQMFRQETAGLPIRLKLIPTELGRSALNPFWPLWLRQMILRKTHPSESFGVEIQNKYVLISGGKSPSGLEATVTALAAQIRPLPIALKLDDDAPEHTLRWKVSEGRGYIPMRMIVDALRVPRGVSVSFSSSLLYDDSYPSLLSVALRHNDERSMRDLRLSVELQIALMCE